MTPKSKHRYAVFAYSSFHLLGDHEKYLLGEFSDCASAITACRKLVDGFLQSTLERVGSAEALQLEYESSGPEPYIHSDDRSCIFSASGYARRRIRELSGQDKKARDASL